MNLRLEVDASSVLHAFAKAPEATRRHLRIAVQVAAEEVKDQAQKVHDFTSRTNELIGSVKTVMSGEGAEARIYLDPTKAPHAAAVHNGSKRHEIRPKDGQALRWPSKFGGFMFAFGPMEKSQRGSVLRWVAKNAPGSRVMFRWPIHPGTKPDPFLYDALRAKEERIQALMTNAVQTALREATA